MGRVYTSWRTYGNHAILKAGTADLGVKLEKFPGVIKGRFYVMWD